MQQHAASCYSCFLLPHAHCSAYECCVQCANYQMHNQAVVPESQLTDLVAPAVVDVTLEVAAAVLGMTW